MFAVCILCRSYTYKMIQSLLSLLVLAGILYVLLQIIPILWSLVYGLFQLICYSCPQDRPVKHYPPGPPCSKECYDNANSHCCPSSMRRGECACFVDHYTDCPRGIEYRHGNPNCWNCADPLNY